MHQKLRNDNHLHNYVKIMLRCKRFSKVMNILMVVVTSQEHFYVAERGRRMQECSLEYVQMDYEHATVSNNRDD